MTGTAKKVLEEALDLSHTEREELVEVLSQSLLPVEIGAEWEAEFARRVEKIQSGRAVFDDAESHGWALRAKFDQAADAGRDPA